MKKLHKTRINLGKGVGGRVDLTGWDLGLPFGSATRRFDDGSVAWFFYSEDGKRSYRIHKSVSTLFLRHNWRIYLKVSLDNDPEIVEVTGWGDTRRTMFQCLRREINRYRVAVSKLKMIKE